MPIRGLTDRGSRRFPVIGKLRKGGERPADGKRPGKELPYWRFTSDGPEIEAAFAAIYGQQPEELQVYLAYRALDDSWSTWKEAWTAGALQHRCDGETCTIWLDRSTYRHDPIPCPGGCKEVGRLNLVLPELLRAGYAGVVTMETHSKHDLLSIQGCLEAVVDARGEDDVRRIAFLLRRVEEEVSSPDDKGGRVRRKHWLVKLEPAADWVRGQLVAAQERLMIADDEYEDQDEIVVDAETGEVLDWSVLETDRWWPTFIQKASDTLGVNGAQIKTWLMDEPDYCRPYHAELGKVAKAYLQLCLDDAIGEELQQDAQQPEPF